ncbi:uncharacterized protein LRP34_001763 [Phaethornis superciliosus]
MPVPVPRGCVSPGPEPEPPPLLPPLPPLLAELAGRARQSSPAGGLPAAVPRPRRPPEGGRRRGGQRLQLYLPGWCGVKGVERIRSGLLGVHPKLVSIWQSQLRSLALEGRPAAGAADEGESLGAEDDGEEKTRTSGDLPVEPEEEGRGMAQDTRRPASELPGLGSTLGEVLISPADPSTGAREETDAAIKH